MKWLKIIAALLLFSNCTAAPKPIEYKLVRVTYYWPGSDGQTRNITSTGKTAVHLKTCAVDPKIFPYGSKLHVKEMSMTFTANDTGKWVKSKRAAKKMGKNVPVIDIFVKSKQEANKLIKKYPHFMSVTTQK